MPDAVDIFLLFGTGQVFLLLGVDKRHYHINYIGTMNCIFIILGKIKFYGVYKLNYGLWFLEGSERILAIFWIEDFRHKMFIFMKF